MEQDLSTAERIVLSAIEQIERVGLEGATVRAIAEAAGVNVAAINYHFGSKEALLEEVLERTRRHGLWESLQELREHIAENDGNIRDGLEAFLLEFLPNTLRYPRLLEAQFHDVLTRQEYGGRAVADTNAYLEAFLRVVEPALRARAPEEQRLAVAQFWAGLIGLGLMPRLFDGYIGAHALSGDGVARYVSVLLDAFLAAGPLVPDPTPMND